MRVWQHLWVNPALELRLSKKARTSSSTEEKGKHSKHSKHSKHKHKHKHDKKSKKSKKSKKGKKSKKDHGDNASGSGSDSGSDSDGSRATGRGRAPSTGSETSSGVSLSSGRGSSSGHSSKGGASTAQSGVAGGTPGKSRYGSPRRARGNVGVSSPAPKASHGRKLSLNLPNRELSGSSALAQAAATAAHGRTGRAAYRPRVRGATGGGTPLAHGPAPPAVPPWG